MSDDGVVQLGGRQRYSKELQQRLLDLLRAGAGIRQIARELGVSTGTASWWIDRHQLRRLATGLEPLEREAPPKRARPAPPARPQPSPVKRTAAQDRILRNALLLGVQRQHAAAQAGWTPAQLERQLASDEGLERMLLNAERECQEAALQVIRESAESNWLPAAWLLERRFGFVKTAEISLAERDKMARAIGLQLADRLVAGFGELGLSADQQEALRVRLSSELEKAATSL
jgi:transposase-like protein